MKLENFEFKRCWRRGGGMFIGLHIHFPTNMVDDLIFTHRWTNISVSIGFIFWRFNFEINYNFMTD